MDVKVEGWMNRGRIFMEAASDGVRFRSWCCDAKSIQIIHKHNDCGFGAELLRNLLCSADDAQIKTKKEQIIHKHNWHCQWREWPNDCGFEAELLWNLPLQHTLRWWCSSSPVWYINIDKAILENIDIDIDKAILKNFDIDRKSSISISIRGS